MIGKTVAAVITALGLASLACAQESAEPQAGGGDPALEELRERLDRQEQELEALRRELREGPVIAEPEAEPGGAEPSDSVGPDDSPDRHPGQAPEPPTKGLAHDHWAHSIHLSMFRIAAEDGSWEVALRGRIQSDFRALAEHRRGAFDDGFQIRRARIEVRAKLFERVTFDLGMEFGRTSDADLRNAYVSLKLHEGLRIRVGQMLLPYSDERLTSSKFLLHPERAMLVANLVGPRDIGALLHGSLFASRIYYSLGVFNGNGQNVKVDADDDLDGALRVEFRPLGDEHLRLSGNYIYTPSDRSQTGPSDLKTVGNELSTVVDYASTNRRLGRRHRAGGGLRAWWGSWQVVAEVNADYQEEVRAAGGAEVNVLTYGWFLGGSFVLTGEELKLRHDGHYVEPERPFFDPKTKEVGPGAFELALRYEQVILEREVFRKGLATGTDRIRAATLSGHWYPWGQVRVTLSYTYTRLDDHVSTGAQRPWNSEHTILARFAVWF